MFIATTPKAVTEQQYEQIETSQQVKKKGNGNKITNKQINKWPKKKKKNFLGWNPEPWTYHVQGHLLDDCVTLLSVKQKS